MQIFLYCELVNMRNLEKVLGHEVNTECQNAVLEDYCSIAVREDISGVCKHLLRNISGIVIALEPDDVAMLMAYFGRDFNLSNVKVIVDGFERGVKTFVAKSTYDYVPSVVDEKVDNKINTFYKTYIKSESDWHTLELTVNTIAPDINAHEFIRRYPNIIFQMKHRNFDISVITDSILECPVICKHTSSLINNIVSLYKEDNITKVQAGSLVLDNIVVDTMSFDTAEQIHNISVFMSADRDIGELSTFLREKFILDLEEFSIIKDLPKSFSYIDVRNLMKSVFKLSSKSLRDLTVILWLHCMKVSWVVLGDIPDSYPELYIIELLCKVGN